MKNSEWHRPVAGFSSSVRRRRTIQKKMREGERESEKKQPFLTEGDEGEAAQALNMYTIKFWHSF